MPLFFFANDPCIACCARGAVRCSACRVERAKLAAGPPAASDPIRPRPFGATKSCTEMGGRVVRPARAWDWDWDLGAMGRGISEGTSC